MPGIPGGYLRVAWPEYQGGHDPALSYARYAWGGGVLIVLLGFAIAAHWSLLLLVIAFFALVYAPTIRREREFVRSRFPAEYEAYERNVPAFVPRPMPWRGGERSDGAPFSFALYLRHREWQAGLVFVLAMLWLAYRMRPMP